MSKYNYVCTCIHKHKDNQTEKTGQTDRQRGKVTGWHIDRDRALNKLVIHVIDARPFPPSRVSYSHSRITPSRSRYLRYSCFFCRLIILARCSGLMDRSTSLGTRSGPVDLALGRAFLVGFLHIRCVSHSLEVLVLDGPR